GRFPAASAERARQRFFPFPRRVRPHGDLRRHPDRQLRARLVLHARRLSRLDFGDGVAARASRLLGRCGRGGAAGRAARRRCRSGAAPPHLSRAGAVPAIGDLRRGVGGAGRGAGRLGAGGPSRAARARLARQRRTPRPSLPPLRAVPHRRGSGGARPPVAAVQPHPLGPPGPGRHGGPRDDRRARHRPAALVHRRVLPRQLARRPGRRLATAAREREPAYGPRGGRRSLRGGGRGRPRQPPRRFPRGAADLGAARLRHPGPAPHHPGAGVRGDGCGVGAAAAGIAGAVGRSAGGRRRDSGGRRRPGAAGAARRRRGGAARGRGLAAVPGRLRALGADRHGHHGALRRQPAFHHGAGRHGELRPRRVFRRGRLRRGAGGEVVLGAHGCGAGAGAARGRTGRVPLRLLLRAPFRRLRRDADLGLRADRVVRRVPVGGSDRRGQRHPRRLARRLGVRRAALLLPGPGALRRLHAAAAPGAGRAFRARPAGAARQPAPGGGAGHRRGARALVRLRLRGRHGGGRRRPLRLREGQRVPHLPRHPPQRGRAADGAAGRRRHTERPHRRRLGLRGLAGGTRPVDGLLAAVPGLGGHRPRAVLPARARRRGTGPVGGATWRRRL
ncbi:MAG: ABC transporter, permease protein 1 (cluster 4, leucine/isoleucine/valine/benzoate) / ABC transporter, permease protein 2 (cluster 4, leucine/isoleucine/valine/benzoate), partial [uncultured Acetobacteraceae bacterium]